MDSGYQGIADIHPNSTMPYKRKRKEKDKPRVPLTKAERAHNHQLAHDRILNEHVIGALKRFRIIADRYRNRRKRFGLRFNLIAGIYNLQVGYREKSSVRTVIWLHCFLFKRMPQAT